MFQTHLFLQRFIKNRTRMTHRRIDEVVQLRYNDISSIEKIIEKIRIILKNNKYVDPNFTPYVFFDTYADYYLKIIMTGSGKTHGFNRGMKASFFSFAF